jgi:DNA primase
MNDVEEIKSRLNIVEIVGEKVRLKKTGANYFGLCPFHSEKTPSFTVNEDLQIFKCFGCGESGDAIKFYQKTESLTFPEALKELAEKVGYTLSGRRSNSLNNKEESLKRKILEINRAAAEFYQENLKKKNNPGLEYIKKRGIEDKTIEIFKIGYASDSSQNLYNYLKHLGYSENEIISSGVVIKKENNIIKDKFNNRIIFSVFDQKSNIIGFSGRHIPSKADINFSPPKYLNSPQTMIYDKSKSLFGLYQAMEAIKKLNFVIVSEGQMNIISSYQSGVKNIVASLGTSFTIDHIKLLRRYTSNIYLAFDLDGAGKKALLRTLKLIYQSNLDINCKVVSWNSSLGKDPDELIQNDKQLWIDSVNKPFDPIEYFIAEFQKKYSSPTIDQKDSFLKIIMPIVASHSNQFKREEYVKKLADYFDVSEDSIEKTYKEKKWSPAGREIKKTASNNREFDEASKFPAFQNFFAILLQNWKDNKSILMSIDRDIIIDEYIHIFDAMIANIDEDNILEIKKTLIAINEEVAAKLLDELTVKKITLDENLSVKEHILKIIPMLIISSYNYVVEKFKTNSGSVELLNLKNKLANMLIIKK